jgi:elongation factor P
MLGITDLKSGTTIDLEGSPFVVLDYQHSKMGRGGAVLRTKLRNLKTGAVVDITFKSSDKFDEAPIERKSCSFLYSEGSTYSFMDSVTYDQFTLTATEVGDKAKYLKEGAEIQILFYDGSPVSIQLPIKMEFEVTYTEPGVKGDTAQGGTKPATIETGATIMVPLFVKLGDIIRVNTEEGAYVERASK